MLLIFLVWNVIGFIILGVGTTMTKHGPLYMADGLEFMNPMFVYKYAYVNRFCAVVLSLLYSVLFPAGAIGYWFYKACTYGRRK